MEAFVSAYANVYFKTILRECLRAGLPSGFPSTVPPPVLVPAVLGTLAGWIPNQKKKAPFVCLLVITKAVMLSPFPLPIPSPPTLGPTILCVLFPRSRPLGGDFPASIMGARRRHLRLARDSANSVCLRAHRYLFHAPPSPHTRPRTLPTPLRATTLHSNLLPANTPAPHSHLYFGYKLPVWGVPLGLASVFAKDRATLHILSRRGRVGTRALVVLPSSLTKERSSVGRA